MAENRRPRKDCRVQSLARAVRFATAPALQYKIRLSAVLQSERTYLGAVVEKRFIVDRHDRCSLFRLSWLFRELTRCNRRPGLNEEQEGDGTRENQPPSMTP